MFVKNRSLKLKSWLQVFRAQTAPATVIFVLAPWMAAGGDLFSLRGLCLGVWALLTHWFSYGMNSLQDSITIPYLGASKTWDQMDPAKGHHPLMAGEIPVQTAQKVINTGILLLCICAIVLILLSSGNYVWALIGLILFYAFGTAYNLQLSCKITASGFIPITLCFTFLGVTSWFLASEVLTTFAILIFLYILLRIWFQIDVAGNIKEIKTIERSIIKKLGAEVRNGYFYPKYSLIYAWILTIAETVTGIWIYVNYTFTLWTLPFVLFFMIAGFFFVWRLVKKREWDRDRSLMDMSLAEVSFIYALPCILAPVIGYLETTVLLIFGVLYFFSMNRLLWKVPYPKV